MQQKALSVLSYFAIFIYDPVPNDSNVLCVLSQTGVTATTETSVLRFTSFHITKTKFRTW